MMGYALALPAVFAEPVECALDGVAEPETVCAAGSGVGRGDAQPGQFSHLDESENGERVVVGLVGSAAAGADVVPSGLHDPGELVGQSGEITGVHREMGEPDGFGQVNAWIDGCR
jgi:hypothetical protein